MLNIIHKKTACLQAVLFFVVVPYHCGMFTKDYFLLLFLVGVDYSLYQ